MQEPAAPNGRAVRMLHPYGTPVQAALTCCS